MPKLSSFTPKKLIALLEEYGFVRDHITGSHYIMYHQAKSTRVVVPYHTKDIPKGTLLAIIKASGIDISLFRK